MTSIDRFQYRYQVKGITTITACEIIIELHDSERHSLVRLQQWDLIKRIDILSELEPLHLFNLGYFCGLHSEPMDKSKADFGKGS